MFYKYEKFIYKSKALYVKSIVSKNKILKITLYPQKISITTGVSES